MSTIHQRYTRQTDGHRTLAIPRHAIAKTRDRNNTVVATAESRTIKYLKHCRPQPGLPLL